MSRRKILIGVLILGTGLLLLSAPIVLAQEIDYCEGDFDCDGDQDGSDAFTFKEDFGRSSLGNPCPPYGPAPVPKTGQTTSYATGDDGDLEEGLSWPNPRFTDNLDGTVTDNLTGLIWLQDANCFGTRNWNNALSDSNGLEDGECGLTDGSVTGVWRLPNRRELFSLIDDENYNPALPSGHPFTNVQSLRYWSSTTDVSLVEDHWNVNMYNGAVGYSTWVQEHYVWPVRGGRVCNTGQTRQCGTDIGECEYGLETCTDGSWGACVGEVPSTDELCDNLDNDCDGTVDGFTQETTCGIGECETTGVETCTDGSWGGDTCTPGSPTAEYCDNLDNDCDGDIDDGLGATTCGIGECARTVDNCVNGEPQQCIPGNPSDEVCNGLDDDCDGAIDEDC